MFERVFLGFDEIIENGPGGADRLSIGGVVVGESEAFQPGGAKMFCQRLSGVLGRKRPGRPPSEHHAAVAVHRRRRQRWRRRRIVAYQTFSRGNARQLVGQLPCGKTGGDESAGRKLDPCQSRWVARRHGGQKIALARIEEGVVGDGAGRDHSRHLAAHESLGGFRVFDLFAHGGPYSRRDQLGQVAVQLMVREAGHRDGVFAFFAARQGETERACGRFGVVVEHLVEIAHAEQQQRIGARPLRLLILFHHGCDVHAAMLAVQIPVGKRAGMEPSGPICLFWTAFGFPQPSIFLSSLAFFAHLVYLGPQLSAPLKVEATMSAAPFRFIHASDFHLERPLMGIADVPNHLRDLFLESPYTAARRVFDAALAEDARFVVLSGGIVTPANSGPRGPVFLAEQFARLAEREIGVYWAGSPIDPPDAWPSAVQLPQNVHFFPRGQIENLLVIGDTGPLAQLSGTSCDVERPWRPADFSPDAGGLYTIAVAHGQADAALLQARGIHYWALGGRHDRSTPQNGPRTIHFCGTTQGRRPDESGVHGCTLVQVDLQQTRISLIPTDAVRWIDQRLPIDETATREELEARLRQRMQAVLEASPDSALLISWTVAGRGPLIGSLRQGSLAAELLQSLRGDFGYRRPPAWSVSLDVELSDILPPEWYEQETIRGDFLRAIRQWQMNSGEPLGLEAYLSEAHRAGALASIADLDQTDDDPSHGDSTRQAVLREAAILGIDLLSGSPETICGAGVSPAQCSRDGRTTKRDAAFERPLSGEEPRA